MAGAVLQEAVAITDGARGGPPGQRIRVGPGHGIRRAGGPRREVRQRGSFRGTSESWRETGVRTMRWFCGATGSWSHSGAHERHALWFSFQHFSQAYWRQVMQKLKVRWNSSVTRDDSSLS